LPRRRQSSPFSLPKAEILANVSKAKALEATHSDPKATARRVFNEILIKTLRAYDPSKLKAYTPNSFVVAQTREKLMLIRDQLKGHEIVGVDLENNHRDSYNGFTCLIQLSTYDLTSGDVATFVVDVLAPEVGDSLSEILGASLFENPNILKLLHGCITSDLQWMVRDFGIKMVSVFDTQEFHKKFISSKELSLANFWALYCPGLATIDVSEKKEMQASNWAERPLRQEQLDYAANDTYFLLNIAC